MFHACVWVFFENKKPVTSASPIWQSADRKGLRRSLICPTVIISSRWAFRSDGCSARGRAVAVAEAGTAFRAIVIRAVAQPHEVNDQSSLSSTPSYELPSSTRFRASFLHLSLRWRQSWLTPASPKRSLRDARSASFPEYPRCEPPIAPRPGVITAAAIERTDTKAHKHLK